MAIQRWFDAHLDLAYLAETGRDMLADPPTACDQPGAVTLKSLAESTVRGAVATIFVQPRRADASGHAADGPWCYSTVEEAHERSRRQIQHYHQWEADGLLTIADGSPKISASTLEVWLLLEGAAGIRTVEDLAVFHNMGIRILALTWVSGTQWAGGDQSGGDVTPEGRKLLTEADRLGMVHDVSHLSERAFWTVLDTTRRPKIASHSNCRSLLPGKQHPERHLSDAQIQALANANGIIGINLFSSFLVTTGQATIQDVVRHIKHITDLTGRIDVVGLGSDMDGGFSALDLPAGIRSPGDLGTLGEALAASGFTDTQIEQFAWSNWRDFFQRCLPDPATVP
ncbi:MAG: dipeptidase [Phycisphaerae bacterium]